ncbi:hypothetical protein bas61_0142 [Escherichia phage EmilieFrey]|nr:hypothetical protein bas61_0142 [Escherichia phage EmilieFrey]
MNNHTMKIIRRLQRVLDRLFLISQCNYLAKTAFFLSFLLNDNHSYL